MTGRRRAFVAGTGLALVFLFASSASLALPHPFPVNVAPGDGYSDVLAQCRSRAGAERVTELFADRFGDLVPALVDSGMLAMLNRAGAKHTLFQKPGGRKVSFIRVTGGNGGSDGSMTTEGNGAADGTGWVATLAFAAGKLEAVLIVANVPPNGSVGSTQNPFSPERLAPILDYRKRLGRECSLSTEDRGKTNRFNFSGKCGRFKARLEYHPEQDAFFVLLHQ